MKNNCRIKLFAWMLTAVLLVCATFSGALANTDSVNSDPTSGPQLADGPAKINVVCSVVSPAYQDSDGNPLDIQKLNAGDSCILVVTVKDYNKLLPDQGAFLYDLPQEVRIQNGVTSGSNQVISWTANGSSQVSVSWVNGKTGNFTIEIPVAVGGVYPLYNMAVIKINGSDTWYRLGKTTITAAHPYSWYFKKPAGQAENNVFVKDSEYNVDPYDFSNTTIEVNGKTYIYGGQEQDPENPQPYYTVTLEKVEVAKAKIGGMNGNTPRWLVPDDSMKYNDPNTNGGYHRNYRITLHTAPVVQVLYNMLQVGDEANYYRLRTDHITAKPVTDYANNYNLKSEEYTLIPNKEYDFTNVVLDLNGVKYTYSDTVKTGDYEAYYTVEFIRVVAKNKVHTNASWFKNPAGWLDGSESDYADITTNDTWGYHRDYKATLHPGTAVFYNIEMRDGDSVTTDRKAGNREVELPVPTKAGSKFTGWNTAEDGTGTNYTSANPLVLSEDVVLYAQWQATDYSVTITSSWPEGQPAYPGTRITLTATLSSGFEGKSYTLQWQYSTDRQNWIDQPGANELTYTYILTEETAPYYWRIVARNVE